MATARALRLVTSSPSSSTIIRGNLEAVVHRRRSLLSASTTTEAGGAGDPALHSGDAPSEEYTDRPPRFSAATATGGGHASKRQPSPSSEPSKERVPPFAPSGNKLGSHQELADAAAGSTFTQRRRFSSSFTQKRQFSSSREAATPGGEEAAARKVREEDREYYRTHKPSPLAELEFADTRKPVTQATDGGAADRLDADVSSGTPATVEDTADDSLARAEAMFRDAASRGNPDWPHSRVLAEMLARRNSREHDAPP